MADIKPFKALRFNTQNAGDIKELTCPPYDIISEEQRLGYLDTNPNNIIRLELPKGDNPYKKAGETLNDFISKEILKRDSTDGYYIYEEEFEAYGEIKKIKGVICRVKLCEFSEGVVLPHEETLSKAKTDRFNLMSETYSNFSQIYSLYNDDNNASTTLIDNASNRAPDVSFTDLEGVTHRLWCVYDTNVIDSLTKTFKDKKVYIADGHHRYETALNFKKHLRASGEVTTNEHPCDYVMMMLVNMENKGLVVFPTHRIVFGLDSFDLSKVLSECSKYFDITAKNGVETIQPELDILYTEGKKAYALYAGDNQWKLLVLKDFEVMSEILPDMSEAYKSLDVSILHSLILEKIFGIDKENMANQINLRYTKLQDEAISEVDNRNANCAFVLNPTRVTQIRDVAAAGEKMPQKSTYFYPKLITGLVMNKFE